MGHTQTEEHAGTPPAAAEFTTEKLVLMAEQEHWIRQQFPLSKPFNESQRRRIKRQRQTFRTQLGLEHPPENRVRWLDAAHDRRDDDGVMWFLRIFNDADAVGPDGVGPAPLSTAQEMIDDLVGWTEELMRRYDNFIARSLADAGCAVDHLLEAAAAHRWGAVKKYAEGARADARDVLRWLQVRTPDADEHAQQALAGMPVRVGKAPTSPPVARALRVYEDMTQYYRHEAWEGHSDVESAPLTPPQASAAVLPLPADACAPAGCLLDGEGGQEGSIDYFEDFDDEGILRMLSIA